MIKSIIKNIIKLTPIIPVHGIAIDQFLLRILFQLTRLYGMQSFNVTGDTESPAGTAVTLILNLSYR